MLTHFKQIVEMDINKDSDSRHYMRDDPKILKSEKEHITNVLINCPKSFNLRRKRVSWYRGIHFKVWL